MNTCDNSKAHFKKAMAKVMANKEDAKAVKAHWRKKALMLKKSDTIMLYNLKSGEFDKGKITLAPRYPQKAGACFMVRMSDVNKCIFVPNSQIHRIANVKENDMADLGDYFYWLKAKQEVLERFQATLSQNKA
jgi:hypothetical protein